MGRWPIVLMFIMIFLNKTCVLGRGEGHQKFTYFYRERTFIEKIRRIKIVAIRRREANRV
jgi:hypothetical protein